jgi:hypothetical protein
MKKIDIKYAGISNVNFSLTKETDDREPKFKRQRLERGFDDTEIWALRDTIAKFIIPRLKVFMKMDCCHPVNMKSLKQWRRKLNHILIALELVARDDGTFELTEKESGQYIKGMKLLQKHFIDLWN